MDPDEIARRCARLLLTEEDGPVAKLGVQLEESGKKQVSLSLFGKILSNKKVNRDAFKAIIASIWRTMKGVEVEGLGSNLFVFRFKCVWERKSVTSLISNKYEKYG
ncbi:hypothetical protein ACOSP7_032680 [Xanthoceras sorbifolium]